MSSRDVIRIDRGELYSPKVEDYLQVQQALRRDMEEPSPQPFIVRILYASWFYLAIAAGLGAALGWGIWEPSYDDNIEGYQLADWLMFPTITALVGLFLGAAEGMMCRNAGRALVCGSVGLGIGFAGGMVSNLLGDVIYKGFQILAIAVAAGAGPRTGLLLFVQIVGRATAWSLAGLPAGIGQGVALRQSKIIFNGLIGGVLGGLLGGLLFDPIGLMLTDEHGSGAISRGVGFTMIGLMVGLFVGLVESWTKTAWLLMRAGPLAGKQFVLFKDAIVLGSSPKAEVYLFKDEAIEPRHAIIYNRGGRFEIEDCNSRDGTYVNGVPVRKQILRNGDKVVLGKTVLEFSIRDSR